MQQCLILKEIVSLKQSRSVYRNHAEQENKEISHVLNFKTRHHKINYFTLKVLRGKSKTMPDSLCEFIFSQGKNRVILSVIGHIIVL